jgi:small-conductance mechanosensitive channel
VRGDKERARTEQETANFMREMEKIDYLHKPRAKGRMREAFEETLTDSLFHALEGNKQAEKVLVGHKRNIDRLDRESKRETGDIERDLAATDKLLASENEGLSLLKKRKDRMEASTPPQPTEIVEGQIVDSSQRIFRYQEQQNKLRERKSRIEQDTAREKKEAYDDVQRQLREAR